jgi:hypothetical protein
MTEILFGFACQDRFISSSLDLPTFAEEKDLEFVRNVELQFNVECLDSKFLKKQEGLSLFQET